MRGVPRQRLMEEYPIRSQQLRPVFEPNQIERYGLWLQIIPHKIRIVLTEPGIGPTPQAGDFIRVKQFVYRQQDMAQMRAQRVTYLFGRQQLIPGLEMCLSLCRENSKARCYISSQYAYGQQNLSSGSQSILPAKTSLVIDIEVMSISYQPAVRDTFEDELLLKEIKFLVKDGQKLCQGGWFIEAQKKYESAFRHIQSTRCKQIKNHLYIRNIRGRMNPRVYNEIQQQAQLQADKKYLHQLYLKFDTIKLTTIQLALKNKDYYKVVILSKECLMENSRLELNQGLLLARGRALMMIGEVTEGYTLIKHISDKHPEDQKLKEEVKQAEKRKTKVKQMSKEFLAEPILSITGQKQVKRVPKNRKIQTQLIDSQQIL